MSFPMVSLIEELFHSASKGILGVYEHPIPFLLFMGFVIWASIHDLRTLTVKNYMNGSFLVVGLILWFLSQIGVNQAGFSLGYGHIYGAVVGFLLLFIPGMVLNYAFGGDIKFVTVMGFWIGPTAILLVMLIATLVQLMILVLRGILTKNSSIKQNFPFAPSFFIAYLLSLFILLIL